MLNLKMLLEKDFLKKLNKREFDHSHYILLVNVAGCCYH